MLSEINMKAVASHHHERMRWVNAPGNAQTFISRLSCTLAERSVMLSEINMKAVASHHHERMRWVVVAPHNLVAH